MNPFILFEAIILRCPEIKEKYPEDSIYFTEVVS